MLMSVSLIPSELELTGLIPLNAEFSVMSQPSLLGVCSLHG